VQSSSITTVMVVGFVNSGVMQLSQAVGVIMGANIGTTITGWILVLKIGKYGLPILGFAAFVYLFGKGERWRFWAMTLMGIGMVFFGLELMKDACSIIKETPAFEEWFARFRADNYLGVLRCALAGCLVTVLVQSSSATLGITISLASQGVISFPTAAALVLGENIGTTITAYLASLGATTNAKRAAYFHIIFNFAGVLWITAIFQPYIQMIQWLIPGDVTQMVSVDGKETYPNTTSAIAATHTVFNVTNTLLFLPLMPLLVRFLERFVADRASRDSTRLTDLDVRMVETPVLAIEQSRREIRRMSEVCSRMIHSLHLLREADEPDKPTADQLRRSEQMLDSMQDEVAEFVTHLLGSDLPHAVADEARRQLRMADEYESISDYIVDLDKFDRKLRRDGQRFTPEQCKGLGELNQHTAAYLNAVNEALLKSEALVLIQTEPLAKRLRDEIKQLRRQHLDDLSDGTISPRVSVAYMATLNGYVRIRDHALNIAEVIAS